MVIERANAVELKRMVILLDSITRTARAYNNVLPSSGKVLTGVWMPMHYSSQNGFGAARKIEEGGSLTIIATALVDTGNRMDESDFEEFRAQATAKFTWIADSMRSGCFHPSSSIAAERTTRRTAFAAGNSAKHAYCANSCTTWMKLRRWKWCSRA